MKKLLVFNLLVIFFGGAVFGERIGEFENIFNPRWMDVKGDELYVLDDCTIKVFSIKKGKILRSFCSRGQGPGEITPNSEMPLQVIWVEDGLFLYGNHKYLHYSTKGTLLKEKNLKFSALQLVPAGKNYVVVKWYSKSDLERGFEAVLCSDRFENLKSLVKNRIPKQKHSTAGVKIPELLIVYSHRGGIFIIDHKSLEFKIYSFDFEGNPVKVIKSDYTPQKVDEVVKEEIFDWYRANDRFKLYGLKLSNLKKRIRYPQFMPVLRNLVFDGDKICAQTYRVMNEKSEFFIIDPKGVKSRKVLPWSETDIVQFGSNSTFCFSGGKYYYILDRPEDELWELHSLN